MGFEDLREYLQKLEELGELVRVHQEVDWNLEAPAIMRRLNELQGEVPLFENIKDYPGYRMTSDLLSTFPHFAVALGLDPKTSYEEIADEYSRRSEQPIKPNVVSSGPCKENIMIGDDVNLLKLPAPMVHDGDGGRYLGTLNVCAFKDPDSDWVNWGIYRIMVHDEKSCGILIIPTQHIGIIHQKYEAMGKPMQLVSFMGGDPLCYVGAATGVPYGVNEVDIIGGLRGKAVDLVRCETSDLMVPATSEIVIEGEILPHVRKKEGPFGEYTGYMTREVFPRPVFQVKAITHRDNPILTVDVEGTPVVMDHIVLSTTLAAEIKKGLLHAGLPVTGIYVPPETANHMVVVAAKRTRYPVAFRIACCVWADKTGQSIPHVIVVDDDVDPTNMREVIHALATKCHPIRGIIQVANAPLGPLTPFLSTEERTGNKGAYVVYDCTWPTTWDAKDIPIRSSFNNIFPKEIQDKVLKKWKQYGFKE